MGKNTLIHCTYHTCWKINFSYEYNAALLSLKTLICTHFQSLWLSLGWFISPHHLSGVLPHPFLPKFPWWSNIVLFHPRVESFHHCCLGLWFLTGWCWWSGCFAHVLSVVVCRRCSVFTDSPWWVLLVSGWHARFHHLHVLFLLMPHFVPQFATLPSFNIVISIFLPVFPVSSPLSLSVNLVFSPPTRLCLAFASVRGAVRASVSALWAKDVAGIAVGESGMY